MIWDLGVYCKKMKHPSQDTTNEINILPIKVYNIALSIMLYKIYEINTNIDAYRSKTFSFLESKLGVFKRYLLDPGNFNKVNSLL